MNIFFRLSDPDYYEPPKPNPKELDKKAKNKLKKEKKEKKKQKKLEDDKTKIPKDLKCEICALQLRSPNSYKVKH